MNIIKNLIPAVVVLLASCSNDSTLNGENNMDSSSNAMQSFVDSISATVQEDSVKVSEVATSTDLQSKQESLEPTIVNKVNDQPLQATKSAGKSKNVNMITLVKLGKHNGSQTTDEKHILGYQIVSQSDVSEHVGQSILNEIANKNNRIAEAKRCAFLPNVAVLNNGVPFALIATKNCPKMLLIQGTTSSFVELKEGSNVAKLINELP